MLRISFRDDDLDQPLESFCAFHELMKKYSFPVSYAVIPGRITKEDANLYRIMKQTAKMDFLQHGWMHTNYGIEKKGEFGIRKPEIDAKEITFGFQKMKEFFEDDFLPVFVPPFHSYTQQTWQAAQSAGCIAFSAKYGMSTYDGLVSLSAHIFVDHYNENDHTFLSAKKVLQQFLRWKHLPFVIFLTHHKKMGEKERKEFENVLVFLKYLEKKNEVTFCSFTELLEYYETH